MFNWLNSMGSAYTNHMISVGRQQARSYLLAQSNRTLQDLGFSRTLLEAGTSYWPWQTEEYQPQNVAGSETSKRDEAKAIRELRALSDRELNDLGITRGTIVEVVRNGRPGIDKPVAASQVQRPVPQQSVDSTVIADNFTIDNSPEKVEAPISRSPQHDDERQAA